MQFLVIGKAYDNAGIPAQLEPGLIRAGLEAMKQDSRVKALYLFAVERGGVGIWEVDSAEDLHRSIAENPMSRLVDWEIHPIITVDQAIASLSRVEQQMAQMSPPAR